MSPRKLVLGLVGAFGLTAATAAEPPVNPLVEGRELDPVARAFHLPERTIGGYVAPPTASDESNAGPWLVMTTIVWDILLDKLTFPLGTAVAPEWTNGA